MQIVNALPGEVFIIGQLGDLIPKLKHQIFTPENSIAKGSFVALIGEKAIKLGKAPELFSLQPKYSHHPNIREYKR